MDDGERLHRVRVWDKPHTVTVYQKSKSVWVAVGSYKDKKIEIQDRSESAAIKQWIQAATDRGN